MEKIQAFVSEQLKTEVPQFKIGDGVKVYIRITEGEKERIQAFAEARGETVNGFINRLIAEAMGVDKTAEAGEDL